MKFLNSLLDGVRGNVRAVMLVIARGLNKLSGGRLHPNTVTIIGLLAHLPIAWLIARQMYIPAAIGLLFFGLFDTLDGDLARLQKRESQTGMLLDSVSDRMKEVIVYAGISLAFVYSGHPIASFWAVAACGASLLVSYVNAWGEAVIARQHRDQHRVNKSFRSGLMTFDVRIAVLIVGLLSGQLIITTALIAVLSWLTAIGRLRNISKVIQQ